MPDVKCINLSFIVPLDKVDEVQSVFDVHAAWMKEFYSESNKGEEHLLHAYFTRARELKDPTDPSKGETGNILFTLNERFTSNESVSRHNEHVKKNEYFQKFIEIKNKYAVFRSAGGEVYHFIK